MRTKAIVLACLLYSGHGRRLLASLSDSGDSEQHSIRRADAVHRQADGTHAKSSSRVLTQFLFAHAPAISRRFQAQGSAARSHPMSLRPMSLQRHSPLMLGDRGTPSSERHFSRKGNGKGVSRLASLLSNQRRRVKERYGQVFSTLRRVVVPTVLAAIGGFLYFEAIAIFVRSRFSASTLSILKADDAQFIQSFLTVIGLLFSILAGNAYSSLYSQQESRYDALYQEVSEAKSLLEQTTLVCQGRPFYQSALACMRDYVKNDLVRLDVRPSKLLSTRPMEDPLESIMYMTSVGVPSIVYETVKNLRQARGVRLGAMQRKFPMLGIALLYFLAFLNLVAFPLLGAVSASVEGVITLQSLLFGCLSGAHMLVLRIIQELWRGSGGVFNVDAVLNEMVAGLEEELELRSKQASAMLPAAVKGIQQRAPEQRNDGKTA